MSKTIAKRLLIWTGFLIFSAGGFLFSAGWLGNDAISAVISTSGSDDLSVSFTVSGFVSYCFSCFQISTSQFGYLELGTGDAFVEI
jgi:hypothetical protein